MAGAPTVSGRRVTLRPFSAGFTEDEIADLYRWSSDPSVLSLSGGSPLDMSLERFRIAFLAQLPRRNSESEQLFAILDESGKMIGRTGLFEIDHETGTAELGIVIGDEDYWGQGYGRDSVRTLIEHAFNDVGLKRIVLYTFADNERARRAYEAAGFKPVRELRRFSMQQGTHSELEMEIVASDQ